MQLSEDMIKRLSERAQQAGLDPQEVIAAAQNVRPPEEPLPSEGGGPPSQEPEDNEQRGTAPSERLLADRMLIGFLPFVTVREFREQWMGLSGDVPDAELFTGEWLRIHGQAPPAATGDSKPDDEVNGREQVPPTLTGEEE